LTFKTSKEQREKSRAKSAEKKVNKAENNLSKFESENPEFAVWWTDSNFDFAISLKQAVMKWGDLTEGQYNAGKRCIEKFNATKLSREVVKSQSQSVDISKIEMAFEKGRLNKIKLRLLDGDNSFIFSRAPESGKNAGSVYVVIDEQYLGKITGGKFIKSNSCSAILESSIINACIDPLQSAVAYGQRFGICSCCGRELTNQESIDLGIGPICHEKFFF
jgi:hypothetical protein